MTPKEVLAQIRQREVTTVDLRFMDFPGVWQHFSIPGRLADRRDVRGRNRLRRLERRGLTRNQRVGPARRPSARDGPDRSVSLAADPDDDLQHPRSDHAPGLYARSPQHRPQGHRATCETPGWPISACWHPSSSFSCSTTCSSISAGTRRSIRSIRWKEPGTAAGPRNPNLGYKPGSGLGYFPCPPTDSLVDLRSEMAQRMAECGIATAAHFHEVATAGQCEIDLVPRSLVESADQVVTAKYIIRNVARRSGKTATFMPKPLFGDNGSGMHTHLTLWKDNQPLLAGNGYAGLSDLGIHAIGGLIKHAAALCAFANPTTNSYKRLVPGLRGSDQDLLQPPQPRGHHSRAGQQPEPRSRRIEYRGPDSAANPYLLFSAMLMAVLDGIQNKLRPGEPLDKDIYDLQPEELDNGPDHPALARGLARSPEIRSRIPAARRCLHAGRHRHLDLVQAVA